MEPEQAPFLLRTISFGGIETPYGLSSGEFEAGASSAICLR